MKRFLFALCALLCGQLHAADKPNIIVILSDDYGYGSAGCYGADPKLIRTPNIDRLAREGRKFTDANTTSSVCSPTRYSLMTGRYCWRTSEKSGVLGVFSPLHIETNRLNMASLLKAHGYKTASVGKWHLGYGAGEGKIVTDYTVELSPGPLDIGFDYHFSVPANHGDVTGIFVENRYVYGLRSGKIPDSMKVRMDDNDDFQATYTKEDTESKRADPMNLDAPRRVNERVMKVLTGKAVRWLEQQKRGTPFFLYFTPVAVHNPITPDKDLAGKSAAGPYGDFIHELDRSVGGILDALDRLGFAKDTLVIFTSDNGGVTGSGRDDSPQAVAEKAGLKVNGALRGRKHTIWEGGFKVPFLVRWPGKAAAGSVCNEMVSLADILATTAAIVGEKLPAASKAAQDSYNILPAILGKSSGKPLRADMIVHSADGVFAIRRGPWKYIEGIPVDNIKPGIRKTRADEFRAQLYNLQDDPAETKDVSAQHPDVVKELVALLDRYRDGDYSRELPPVVVKPKVTIELPPVADKMVLTAAFDKVPGAPWNVVRGKWIAKDGAVWGTEKPSDKAVAAFRHPLALKDGDVQYELSLPPGASHTLRFAKDRDRVVHIQISSRKIAITDLATGKVLAESPAKLAPNTWLPVRACFRGNDLIVQVADAALKATTPMFGETKTIISLLVSGEEVGFRKLSVATAGKE
ncbi:MAG: arylsulfatase [Verrucomicrobia bacterium]|nr:arylsulfatase [Verrucomicrobiota bacterium]